MGVLGDKVILGQRWQLCRGEVVRDVKGKGRRRETGEGPELVSRG